MAAKAPTVVDGTSAPPADAGNPVYGPGIPLGAMMPGYVQRGPVGSANFQPWAADYLNENGGAFFGTLGEPAAYCAGMCKEDGKMVEPFTEAGSADAEDCHVDLSTGRGTGKCSYVASDTPGYTPPAVAPTVADEPYLALSAASAPCYKTAMGSGFAGVCPSKISNDM